MLNSYALKSETREDKVMRYLPLVKFIAARIMIGKASPVDVDDLVGYGIIGLMDAIDKFDPSKGVKFETYASLRIKGSIIDELRKLNWMPRSALAKVSKLNGARDSLRASLGREPDDGELASSLGLDEAELRKAESYINYLSVISLDQIIFQSEDDEVFLHSTLEDSTSPRPEKIIEENEKRFMLKKAIEMLDQKDRMILNLYYYEKLTLKEIGQVLEVSESRVSQIHSRTIMRLRDNLKKLKYYTS